MSEILSGGSERPMLIGLVFIAGIVILAFWLANLVSGICRAVRVITDEVAV